MRFYTGVTDNGWYEHLAGQGNLDEVNFWHPNGSAPFKNAPEGTPFLFKLKSPNHHIAGGGFLIKYESLPLRLAWEAFGERNGASTFAEFSRLIRSARGRNAESERDVGCSILGDPFFFPRSEWIPMADDFRGSVVRGKFFDTADEDGKRIWAAVQQRLQHLHLDASFVAERQPMYGAPVLVRPRRGQGAFRALVTNAYGRRCAITGESTLPVLEAAHIKPVAAEGWHSTSNGLLLRSDFHRLFDHGLVTVTPEHRVLVSERIKTSWFNGKAYNRLHGELLKSLPAAAEDHPSADLLSWHNNNVYEKESSLA
jgi:putative restriction endonuclease